LQEQVVEETNEDDNDQNGHEEDFFCEICNKEFKTENQLKNHKPSKAHQKKVKELYDQVALEEEKGDIDDTTETQGKEETGGKSKKRRKKKKNQNNEIIINDNSSDWKLISPDKFKNEQPAKKSEPQKQKAPLSSAEENENQSADEEIDMIRYLNPGLKKTTKAENTEPTTDQEKIKDPNPDQEPERISKFFVVDNDDNDDDPTHKNSDTPKSNQEEKKKSKFEATDESDDEKSQQPGDKKLNKAKLKKLKKQAKEETVKFKCGFCKEVFDTRNKMFQHLKSSAHEFNTK